jgi:hypothetical protein
VDEPPRSPSAREFVEAFVRPARVIEAPHRRLVDDEVLVVSHIEIWRWRVVVRGLRGDPNFRPSRREVSTIRHGAQLVDVAPEEGHPLQRDIDWLPAWRLTDDVGTVYRNAGGTGDFRSVLWTDFSVAFEPTPPVVTSVLNLLHSDVEISGSRTAARR